MSPSNTSDQPTAAGSLQDRVVVVTGAGRGLGRSYAEHFGRDGAQVVVADVNGDGAEETADLVRSAGAAAVAVTVDVTDESSTLAMAKQAEQELGRIDVLVNNAGLWGDLERAPLLTVDRGYWDTVLAVNLTGPLLCSRAVFPAMQREGRGRIINISSMGAYMPAGPYSVSKLGLNQLTYSLAKEVGDHGITVNAVAPGTMDNEATHQQVPDAAFERLVSQNVVKRAGSPDDVYGLLRYLASDDSEWITGQTFLVNGGFSTRF